MEFQDHDNDTNQFLEGIGWDREYQIVLDEYSREQDQDTRIPGRVCSLSGNHYRILTENGECAALWSGGWGNETDRGRKLFASFQDSDGDGHSTPAVGDWVLIEQIKGIESFRIATVLPRRNRLSRTGAGRTSDEQVMAANIDTVFIVTSLDSDFNVRRLERYLSMAHEIGARPVIILNKADACDSIAGHEEAVHRVASDTPVITISATEGTGIEAISPFIETGKTIVLVGSSGVGKSTLINRLLGYERQKVGDVRSSDGKGRHVTTTRELIPLPDGGVLIDNPGIRELALWSDGTGIAATFAEIGELAQRCRFKDCSHGSEPGCAVKKAVESGELPEDRLASYRKLIREQEHAQRRHSSYERNKHDRSLSKMYRNVGKAGRVRKEMG